MDNTIKAQVTKINEAPKKYYELNNYNSKHFKDEQKHARTLMGISFVLGFATVALSFLAVNYSTAYKVKVNNTVVGTVATKGEYYEVLDEVKTEVKTISDTEFKVEGEETFDFEIVERSSLTEKNELAENLKATSDEMVNSYSIFADGEFLLALHSKDEADSILNTYLLTYTNGNENITAEFAQNIEVKENYVPQNTLKTKEEAYSTILAGEVVSYVPTQGESLAYVASKYNVTKETISDANNLENEEIFGKTLLIYTGKPYFSVKTVEHICGEVDIEFETEYKDDNTLYQGRSVVEVKGENGKKYIDSYVTKIDGEITEENIIEEELLKEPTTQIERVGTKEPPPSVGTGSFVMPASGRLTSPYGSRWGRTHAGIDVAAKTGTPIYAADNGIVTEARYKNNGYGNFIAIDHQNGYVTYYAHCSQIKISEGDIVAKGDLIGTVGNTGRSTGPHLHFEIRLDGQIKNPLNYVK